jgi:hypothetical protein
MTIIFYSEEREVKKMEIIKNISRVIFICALTTILNIHTTNLAWWILTVSFWIMNAMGDVER